MIINNFNIDVSDMPGAALSRRLTITGEIGAQFIIIALQNPSSASAHTLYYDFENKAFESGHNDLNNKQEISLPNPFYEALPSINEIINKNRGVDLLNEEITLADLGTQAPEPTVSQQLTTPINITPSSMEGVNQNQGTGTEQRPAEDRIKDFDFRGVIR
jgi:hypothetical protein